MYQHILVALDHSDHDQRLLNEIIPFALKLESQLTLLHIADGWAARHYNELNLAESEEMKADKNYLCQLQQQLTTQHPHLIIQTHLALGSPAQQILSVADQLNVNLIAMASHGHKWISDMFLGTTITHVRHHAKVPIFIAPPETKKG
jgi:manganese transport protein